MANIKAVCMTWSEWQIDEHGSPTVHETEFDGVEVDYYNVYDDDGKLIQDVVETYEQAREIARANTN